MKKSILTLGTFFMMMGIAFAETTKTEIAPREKGGKNPFDWNFKFLHGKVYLAFYQRF